MKKYAVVLMVLVSGLASAQESAYNVNRGWFAGLSVGRAEYNDDSSSFGGLEINSDDASELFHLNGGYQFNRYLGLEGGYVRIGDVKTTYSSSSIETRAELFRFLVYGRLPLGERWALVAKAGGFTGKLKGKFGGITVSDYDKTKSGAAFEFGVHYKFAPQWTGVFEGGRYDFTLDELEFTTNDDGDFEIRSNDRSYNYVQLGVRYHF